MLLTSALLTALPRVRHGFTTRKGGVSTDHRTSWNFGPDDDPAALAENRKRLLTALGVPAADLIQVSQVHGARVVDGKDSLPTTEADGLVESRSNKVLGIRTADCAPLLMAGIDVDGRTHIAAVHAGWRGAVANIQSAAVRTLTDRGVPIEEVRVAVGPMIGFDAFEVGDEVVEAARRLLDTAAPRLRKNDRGRWHLDLSDLIIRALTMTGVRIQNIENVGGCTVDNPDLFFSHRRDRGQTGRHIAAIALVEEDSK